MQSNWELFGYTREENAKSGVIVDFLKTCWNKDSSKKILIFFSINLAFMFVELFYGIYTNSLGLISDSFHMLFDCLALLFGLCASYMATCKADN